MNKGRESTLKRPNTVQTNRATSDVNNTGNDFGVSWSVDGGKTYGIFDLVAGQTVQFQINMHEGSPGTHYANFMKLWVDWDNSGTFEEETDIAASEKMYFVLRMVVP